MAEKEIVYASSIARFRTATIVVTVVVGFFLTESVYGIMAHFHNPLVWFELGGRVLISTALLGTLAFVYFVNKGRSLRITSQRVTCVERNKSFTIPAAQLILRAKKGQKTNRTLIITDGTQMFRVDENFWPQFNDLYAQLKAMRERIGSETTSVFHTKTGGY